MKKPPPGWQWWAWKDHLREIAMDESFERERPYKKRAKRLSQDYVNHFGVDKELAEDALARIK
jgi:hypothetical protein